MSTERSEIGPYKLANRIAVGGMAEVFRALLPQQAGGDRAVVIKRMLPELLAHPDSVRMFHDEGALGQRIRHPNVVEVLDRGVDDGAPYIVLEYVFGVDLRRLQRHLGIHGQTLDTQVALYIAAQMLDGLEAVHQATGPEGRPLEVVHRDVSPSNIFLSVHGEIKLGDLGIAQATLRENKEHPVAREAKGKLGYTAPEALRTPDIDQRADVFAAAVVAAELLLGKPLFVGATELAVLLAIRDGDLTALSTLEGQVDERIPAALRSALSTDPEQRTQSAATLAASLRECITQPPEKIARRLGRFVVQAMESGQSSSFDRGALARTVEADQALVLSLGAGETPTPVVSERTIEDLESLDTSRYEVRQGDQVIGPMSYAEVIRGLVSDHIEPSAQVRREGQEWRPLDELPELARHLLPSSRTPTRLRMRMAQTTELHDLVHASVVEVLAQAYARRISGLLLFEREGIRKEVYLNQGSPVFVSSNQPGELLGQSLIEAKLLEKEDLDRALGLIPRFEGRLGETLVALGLIKPIPLFRHISNQVREKVLELFTWTSGRVAYYDEVEPPDRGFRLDVDAWGLFDAGIERRLSAGIPEDSRFDPPGEHQLIACEPNPLDLGLAELPCSVWNLLATPHAVAELQSLPIDPGRVRRAVHLLLALDSLRWVA